MDKRAVRHLVAQRKTEYSDAQFEQMSRKILDRLQNLSCYQEADILFAYMDMPGEVKMRDLIRRSWEEGKTVAVPKIVVPDAPGTDHRLTAARMCFLRIDSFEDLREGMMHIQEPDPERCECLDQEEKALIIMPGVAFDTDRHRIGYGGGFYDRYLAMHPDHPTVAAAYEFQIFDKIPSEQQDIRPQLLVTEERIL